jgi:hypothetical protein
MDNAGDTPAMSETPDNIPANSGSEDTSAIGAVPPDGLPVTGQAAPIQGTFNWGLIWTGLGLVSVLLVMGVAALLGYGPWRRML